MWRYTNKCDHPLRGFVLQGILRKSFLRSYNNKFSQVYYHTKVHQHRVQASFSSSSHINFVVYLGHLFGNPGLLTKAKSNNRTTAALLMKKKKASNQMFPLNFAVAFQISFSGYTNNCPDYYITEAVTRGVL